MDLNEYYGVDPRELSTLSLAYVGDAVFELMVRTELISRFNTTAGALHKKAKQIVNAKAQSDMYFRIEKYFDETEKAVFKIHFSPLRTYILPNGVSETTDSRALRFSFSPCCAVS